LIICVVEAVVRDCGLGEADVDELWWRWRDGQPFDSIASVLSKPQHHLRWYLAQTGGIRPANFVRRRHT
jgi:hypothetical protein